MADSGDQDGQKTVLTLIDDPVVANADTPQLLGGPFEEFGPGRSRVVRESIDFRCDLALSIPRQSG